MDVARRQLLSVSVLLIPFIEHGGSTALSWDPNMERQDVPFEKPNSAISNRHREQGSG